MSAVSSALTDLNSLSQTLGGETGTALIISSGGLVNASSGKLDSSGDEVFTLKAASSFPSGTFTINGNASQTVVVNVPAAVGNFAFKGSLVLTGGLAPDQVLFNFDQGNCGNFSGGTTGTFLDPNGIFRSIAPCSTGVSLAVVAKTRRSSPAPIYYLSLPLAAHRCPPA